MKVAFIILLAGFLTYAWFAQEGAKEKEAQIEAYEIEIAELKASLKSKSKVIKESPAPELPVETPTEVVTEVTEEVTTEVVEEPIKVDNSPAIEALKAQYERDTVTYETHKERLDSEIKRGNEALVRAMGERPNFNDSRVRTSEADKQIWQREKGERVANVRAALDSVKSQREALETSWRKVKTDYNQKLRDLK
jgi:hypothetical protein